MKKIVYISPDTTVVTVALQQMIALSGGGSQEGDPQIDPDPDGGSDDPRKRSRRNVWEDEEIEMEEMEEDW
jgi:hypothetical protein